MGVKDQRRGGRNGCKEASQDGSIRNSKQGKIDRQREGTVRTVGSLLPLAATLCSSAYALGGRSEGACADLIYLVLITVLDKTTQGRKGLFGLQVSGDFRLQGLLLPPRLLSVNLWSLSGGTAPPTEGRTFRA